ncbi:MAG TPA: pilus assembly protein TadG-related protein [Burkholderiaceae bacterium]
MHANRKRAAGQALVLCVLVLLAGAMALYFLFSTAQVSSTRHRLNNAADAAAWSAALWRARVLNYHAYANRAIVAQEVAIAQAVTLAAWAKYFETFTGTASALSAAYPPVAAVLAVSAELARTASVLATQTAGEEIAARDTYKRLLATSQELMHRSADTFGLGAVANEVARANDKRFFAFALPDDGEFPSLTRRYEGADRARLKSVVDDSLDHFVSGPRGLDLTLWLLPSLCFGNPLAGFDAWFHALHKRGGTVMAPELERWEAGDTMSLHGWRYKSGFLGLFRGCRQYEALPLGWGGAEASGGGAGGFHDDSVPAAVGGFLANPGNVRYNAAAAELAEAGMLADAAGGYTAFSGIAEVRELDYAALANPRFPRSQVAVLARAEGEDVRTANVLNVGVGRLRMHENYAGRRLWAVSTAEVYFRRPASAPERVEYASLYSPYWQVRLTEPSAAQRARAQAYVR